MFWLGTNFMYPHRYIRVSLEPQTQHFLEIFFLNVINTDSVFITLILIKKILSFRYFLNVKLFANHCDQPFIVNRFAGQMKPLDEAGIPPVKSWRINIGYTEIDEIFSKPCYTNKIKPVTKSIPLERFRDLYYKT